MMINGCWPNSANSHAIMDPEKPGYRDQQGGGSQVDLLPTLLIGCEYASGRATLSGPIDGLPGESPQRIAYLNSFQQLRN